MPSSPAASAGLLLVVVGLILTFLGLLLWLGTPGWLAWFGRLPGDVRIERETVEIYLPITSMLLLSAVLTLLLWLLRKLF